MRAMPEEGGRDVHPWGSPYAAAMVDHDDLGCGGGCGGRPGAAATATVAGSRNGTPATARARALPTAARSRVAVGQPLRPAVDRPAGKHDPSRRCGRPGAPRESAGRPGTSRADLAAPLAGPLGRPISARILHRP